MFRCNACPLFIMHSELHFGKICIVTSCMRQIQVDIGEGCHAFSSAVDGQDSEGVEISGLFGDEIVSRLERGLQNPT